MPCPSSSQAAIAQCPHGHQAFRPPNSPPWHPPPTLIFPFQLSSLHPPLPSSSLSSLEPLSGALDPGYQQPEALLTQLILSLTPCLSSNLHDGVSFPAYLGTKQEPRLTPRLLALPLGLHLVFIESC